MDTLKKSLPRSIAVVLCLLFSVIALAEEFDPAQSLFEEAMDDREAGKIYDAIKLFENILATYPVSYTHLRAHETF